MAGTNLYPLGRSTSTKTAAIGSQRPCVFISHYSGDKETARKIAHAVMNLGLDVYFDEYDADLALAAAVGDDLKIAQCIEKGLDRSTHLLGVITDRTFGSWWVPYEIGGSTGRGRAVAHIVDKKVHHPPSYLSLGAIIRTVEELRAWATSTLPATMPERYATSRVNLDSARSVLL